MVAAMDVRDWLCIPKTPSRVMRIVEWLEASQPSLPDVDMDSPAIFENELHGR